MRRPILAAVLACAVAGLTAAGPTAPAGAADAADAAGDPSAGALAIAREVLPANDGWAAAGTGTTGGSAADDAHVFVAHNRAELIAALGGDNLTNRLNATPKIVFLRGRIDANVDDANAPLTCADYADPEYSLEAYLATYDPAVWGRVAPAGRWRRPGCARPATRAPGSGSTSGPTPPSSAWAAAPP